jgi:hypothetical protein
MHSKSIKGKSITELEVALAEVIDGAFKPTLAIAFCSINQDVKGICQSMDDKGIAVFGCTTNGEFIDEETEQGSWAILMMDLNPDYFQIYLEEYPNKNYREVGINIAQKAKSKFDRPAFLIGISHMEVDGEEILRGFEEVAGKDVNIFGGAAGDDYAFQETFVFTHRKMSNCGIVCLVLDESKVEVKGIATCGWKAIGTEKTVTKSEGNHVYTIEDIPVVDITARYGGLENISPDNENLWVELGCNLPLQVQRENGDPVMRGGLRVDWSDRSYYTSGTVPQGSKVRFSLPPDWDVMDKVIQGVKNLKDTSMPETDALVVFSCAGRLLSFGPLMSEEIAGMKNIWNVPMVGMFSNAELGRGRGGNLEMHALTTCCIALKEK